MMNDEQREAIAENIELDQFAEVADDYETAVEDVIAKVLVYVASVAVAKSQPEAERLIEHARMNLLGALGKVAVLTEIVETVQKWRPELTEALIDRFSV